MTQVSVVIPTFNRAHTIHRAIDSVLSQSHLPVEIIVVDDGSSDETAKLIESQFKGSVKYISQANKGVSAARNEGVKSAIGEWIAFLDSDDEWLPRKLEMQFNALAQQREYEFCHSDEIWIRNGVRVNAMTKHQKSGGFIFKKCLPLCVISPSSVLMRKSIFDKAGYFDESLEVCEDYDYWLRYCCDNPVLYIDKPLIVKYGGHDDQLSKKFIGMDLFRLQSLINLLSSGSLSPEQFQDTAETFSKKFDILKTGSEKHRNVKLIQQCNQLEAMYDNLMNNSKKNIL